MVSLNLQISHPNYIGFKLDFVVSEIRTYCTVSASEIPLNIGPAVLLPALNKVKEHGDHNKVTEHGGLTRLRSMGTKQGKGT